MSRPAPRGPGSTALDLLLSLIDRLQAWLAFVRRLLSAGGRQRIRASRPWQVRIQGRQGDRFRRDDVERLLKRQSDLKDHARIAAMAAAFRVPESDCFARRERVEALARHILRESPPWLYFSRVLKGGESGGESGAAEILYREQETREHQEVTLYVPGEEWRDTPLSSLTLRPAKHMGEVWHARLLDQVLPAMLLLDRQQRGEVMVPVRGKARQRLEFEPETRIIEQVVRRQVAIPVETVGGTGSGGQLLYFLLDSSASMRGLHATIAMTVISCVLRANMGQRDTRYLFRHFSEEVWPPVLELPLAARTVREKDALFDQILGTNFNGWATYINDALSTAAADIVRLRREERLDASLLLVTDGRSEIMPSTRKLLSEAHVKVHTILVTPERNPGLEALSETFTTLNIQGEDG